MKREFSQLSWSPQIEEDCRRLVRLAVYEDLDRAYDWTTVCLVPSEARGAANIVARQAGTIAGLAAVPVVLDEMDIAAEFHAQATDGDQVAAGAVLAILRGAARDLLTAERTILNLL